jgi:NitT/TauT family transport system substrate-binding protein
MMKKFPLIFLVVVVLIISGCSNGTMNQQPGSSSQKNTDGLEKIRMASWSNEIVEQSNLYVAEEKGWFENAGIDYEFVPGAGGGEAVKNIVAGNADIAFANIEAVLLAIEKGADLKIIYNIYPENVFNLVSLKENHITGIEELKGKNIGVYSLSSGTYQNLQVLLHSAGMAEKDINIIPTGVLNFAPLMNGKVAATAATDTGLYDAKQKGLGDVDVMEVKNVLNTPSDVFVVTSDVYEKKQDALVNFLQVYKDSTQYMMEHPKEVAKVAVEKAIDGKDEARNLEIIKIRNKSAENKNELGWLDPDIVKKVEQTYVELGLLKKSVQIESVITNDLVEKLK